jgi:hypothetical protein
MENSEAVGKRSKLEGVQETPAILTSRYRRDEDDPILGLDGIIHWGKFIIHCHTDL